MKGTLLTEIEVKKMVPKTWNVQQYLRSIGERVENLEKNIEEIEQYADSDCCEDLFHKFRQLSYEMSKIGAVEALRTCVALQLVIRLHLRSRVQYLLAELRLNLRSFKENLIIIGA